MGLLWAGAEDIDVYSGQTGWSTTAGEFRSNMGIRGGLYPAGDGTLVRTNPFPGGAVTSLWYTVRMHLKSGYPWAGSALCGLGKIGLPDLLCIYVINAGGKLSLGKSDGVSMTHLATEAATSITMLGITTKIDICVTSFADTVNGNCKVYINGAPTPIINFTGNMTTTNLTSLDCTFFTGRASWAIYSELIVSTEDTRSMGLVTLAPDAAGDALWEGGAYSDINEQNLSDANAAYTNTGDDDFQVNVTGLPTGSYRVRGVVEAARAVMTSDATPNGIALGVKTPSGTDYGTKQNLYPGWATYYRLMDQDPTTTADWVNSDVAAMQMSLRAKT